MDEAQAIWVRLGTVPVDDDGYMDEPFLHFPRGTHREDVWHWLEATYPGFSVATAPTF